MRGLLFVASITIFYPCIALSALSDHFVTTWKTDQVPPGTNYVAVPIFDGPCDIDWDGDTNDVTPTLTFDMGQSADMTSAYI
jgi:hypothetical protein